VAGYEYDGGIIIAASHLPFNRNGFKFFTKDGSLEKGNIKDLLQWAAAAAHAAGMSPNARHMDDALVLDAALNIDPTSTPKVSSKKYLVINRAITVGVAVAAICCLEGCVAAVALRQGKAHIKSMYIAAQQLCWELWGIEHLGGTSTPVESKQATFTFASICAARQAGGVHT